MSKNRCKVKSVFPHGSAGKLYYEFFDNKGKIRQKSTGLKNTKENVKKAWKNATKFEERLRQEGLEKKQKRTFAYYADKYVVSVQKSGHTKAKTQAYRVERLKLYFGADTLIEEITELDIEEFFQELEVSLDTKRDWKVVLNKIFELARKDKAIPINIVKQFQFPDSEVHHTPDVVRMPYSVDEKKLLLLNADRQLKNYLGIGFELGLRPEEILGLMVQDIDFESQTVYVKRVVVDGTVKPVTKKKGGERDVPLFDDAVNYINDLISWAKEKNSMYLFSDDNGERLNDSSDIRGKKGRYKSWAEYQKRLGITPIRRLVNTRHTFAIHCIRNIERLDLTLNDIASMLGHTSLRMLFNHYGKYLKDKNKKINRSLSIYTDCEASTDYLTDFGEKVAK